MQFYDSFGLRFVLQTRPLHLPVSASCSSDRDFAADFLQIPSHDRHPCLELTLPTIMACSGFAPYSYHPCRANKKIPAFAGHFMSCGLVRLLRRDRDSNPGRTYILNGFQDRRIQPLCQLSIFEYIIKKRLQQ